MIKEKVMLTIFMLAEMIIGRLAGVSETSFIDRTDAELIHILLLQFLDFQLSLRSVCFSTFGPVWREFVFLFHDVMKNWPAAVALGFRPFKGYALIVVIDDIRLSGFTRRI